MRCGGNYAGKISWSFRITSSSLSSFEGHMVRLEALVQHNLKRVEVAGARAEFRLIAYDERDSGSCGPVAPFH